MKSFFQVVGAILAVIALLIIGIANNCDAPIRFWFAVLPVCMVVFFILGLGLGSTISKRGRVASSAFLVVGTAICLIVAVFFSHIMAGMANLPQEYWEFGGYATMRGLIWWACSTIPMIGGTISAWRSSSSKKL